jgi:hypothetical protein
MLDKSLSRIGTIQVEGGEIHLDGFEVDGGSSREVAALALLWAIGHFQEQLLVLIRKPGGSGLVSVD